MGVVIKAQNDWRDDGRPQVAMHRNCTISSFQSSLLVYLIRNKLVTAQHTDSHIEYY